MRFGWRAEIVVALLAAAAVLAPAVAAFAQDARREDIPAEARQRFDLATTLYSQGRFAEAAAEFERVYELTSLADVQHNIYVAYRDAGEKRKAAAALRRYLAEAGEITDRAVLEARLETLDREIAEEDALAAEQAEEPVEEPAVEPPPEPVPTPEPHPLPVAPEPEGPSVLAPVIVIAAGAVIVGAGAVVGLTAAGQYSDLEDDCGSALICRMDMQEDIDSLQTTALIADLLMAGGGLVAIAGGVWLGIALASGDDAPAPSARVSPWCTPDGCSISVRGVL